MNDVIFETVISTVAADGTPHVAPMGVRYRRTEAGASDVILMPFKPSTTLANIVADAPRGAQHRGRHARLRRLR